MPDEREGRRVGVAQVRAREELAAIEVPVRVDAALVLGEGRELLGREVLDLGDADAVLARDHAAQGARELHDARDRLVRLAQHLVVVGVHRDVGVHVAVAGMHVERDKDAAAQHLRVRRLDRLHDRLEIPAREDRPHAREDALPGGAADRCRVHA